MDTKWKFVLAATAVLGSVAVYYQITKQAPTPRKSLSKRKKSRKPDSTESNEAEVVVEQAQTTIVDIPADVLLI